MSAIPARRLGCYLGVLAACYFAVFVAYPRLFVFAGVNHYGVLFLDLYAVLASSDAAALGLDPYAANPLDYFHRPHIYSPWWLHLHDLGLTRADDFRLGLGLVVLFLFLAVRRLRPASAGELGWQLVILCASPVLLAVNRANNDLVIFVLLAPVVPCLLSPRRVVRFAAIGLVALAAGLKFYPAVAALVLVAGAEPREARRRVIAAVLALAFVALTATVDLGRVSTLLPKAEGVMTFGAENLFESLGLAVKSAQRASVALGLALAGAFVVMKPFAGWKIAEADRDAWWSFVLAAALLTGCFFSGTNYAYRWVFALWLAPLLWRLPRDAAAPVAVRRLALITAVLLPLMLWGDPLACAIILLFKAGLPVAVLAHRADVFFAAEQPLVWAFFGCLLGFLVHFLTDALRNLVDRR